MEFNTVLDISSIIWDEKDYNSHTDEYYKLVFAVSTLLEKFEKEKPKILLRKELQEEMVFHFPFDKLPDKFYEFGNIVYLFLGNVGSNFITYPDNILPNIISIPNQIKAHYNDKTKSEVNYLISKIHSDGESYNVYFSFKYLYGGNDKLKTEVKDEYREYDTIISDNGNELDEFFAKFKPAFEHYSKHDKTLYNTKEKWEESDDKDGVVTRLSCYNNVDNIEPQRILESRYPKKLGEYYYSYDTVNEVYVVFRFTRLNIYHGYDENNLNKIPNEVRKHFNK